MYVPLLLAVASTLGLTAAGPLSCPGTSVFSAYPLTPNACTCVSTVKTLTTTTALTTTTTSPLVTQTTTVTTTAPTVTSVVTVTTSVTTTTDSTTTIIPPVVTLTDTTTSTSTTTCFTTGGVQALLKRGLTSTSPAKPPTTTSMKPISTTPAKPATPPVVTLVCSAIQAQSTISGALYSACSCLGLLPTSTSIVTARTTKTVTLPALTTTSTVIVTTTPTTTTTTTLTNTITNTNTVSTTLVAVTTTTTTTVSTSTVQPTGLAWYYYNPINYVSGYQNEPDVINGLSNNPGYSRSGTVQNINGLGSGGSSFQAPDGTSVPNQGFAMIFQGYLYALDGAGVYTVTSRAGTIDDHAYLWGGNKAYQNNWSYNNYDYRALYPDGGSAQFTLAANEALPLTIMWGNGDGPSGSDYVISGPGGTFTDTSRFFVGDCGNNFIP